ncbi:MAG TPA: hypothetical protein PLY59_06170 [Clostridiales bacterium]|nr:hypothetical protein [Clostridiales bacterium]
MKKKIISSLLALLLLFTCSLPVYGAQTSKEMSSALQKKYGMNITFVTNYTESEKLTLLEQLDSILSHLGAAFVREVVSCYTQKGYTVTIRLERLMWGNESGSFGVSNKNAVLKTMTMNGRDDKEERLGSYSFVHEFGHMVHYALDLKKGSSHVKKKWDSCGTGAYVTEYARQSFREDFAETFAHVAAGDYSQAFLMVAVDNDSTGVLKNKVDCLDTLLGENFKNFTTIRKMYRYEGTGAVCSKTHVSVNGNTTDIILCKIRGNNYIKLRDLAMILRGTEKQFEVTWDSASKSIAIIPGEAYTEVGGELANDLDSYEKAMPANARIFIGDNEVFPTAYNINGNNYFKLRDIAKELDFGVDWKNWTVVIDTTTGYVDE